MKIDEGLRAYIEREILPRYEAFDQAHQRSHVDMVINWQRSTMRMKTWLIPLRPITIRDFVRGVNNIMLFQLVSSGRTNTCCNGLAKNRLKRWPMPRRTIGLLQVVLRVAEADRYIEPKDIVRRTVQFGVDHYPELNREEHYQRMLQHLHEKYGRQGYLLLWFEDSPNAQRLEQLRQLIDDEEQLRKLFDAYMP